MKKDIGDFLVEKKYITTSQLISAREKHTDKKTFFDDILIEFNIIDELNLAKAKAEFYHVPFIDLQDSNIDSGAALKVPEKFSLKNLVVPYSIEQEIIGLAMYNPRDFAVIQDIEATTGMRSTIRVATRSAIEKSIDTAYNVSETLDDVMKNVTSEGDLEIADFDYDETDEENLTEEELMIQEAPVIKMVNMIIIEGVRQGASDIHVEPQEKYLLVRSRLDGVLRKTMQAPKWMQLPVISRLKIMSKMDISEKRKPQDGKIRTKVDKREIDLRVSSLPTRHGEKIVIRILDQSKSLLSLHDLGMSDDVQADVYSAINQPQGMILVTGPTGSGKTTSLYSFLSTVHNESVNIVTLEDPIEYELKGINQVQINEKAGLTFASALRSVLRQDPNIVMIGEIRDQETAEIAIKASQTGHLVFSTLHTNDTVSTITRLIDIGIDPYLVSSSVIMILAQRLIRKNCPDCRVKFEPDEIILHQLGLEKSKEVSFYHGTGCETCKHTGYKGRIGIYEVLMLNTKLREKISAGETEEVIKQTAINEGMMLLITDAIQKVKEGIATPDEVARVIHVEEMAASAYCHNCGKPVRPEYKVCPYCSQVLNFYCENCNFKLEPDWKYCPMCMTVFNKPEGTDLQAQKTVTKSRPKPPPKILAKGMKPKILIADDEPKILLMVKASLKQLNYEVITANDGEEGLQMVDKHRPNLIISDINMPKLNGYEFCKAVRRNLTTAFIPFIMLTSRDTAEDKLKGFKQGTDDYMTKPFDYKELQERVKRLLERTYG